jgi:hypothetical protein
MDRSDNRQGNFLKADDEADAAKAHFIRTADLG